MPCTASTTPGGRPQALRSELRVAHAVLVPGDVVQALAGLVVSLGVDVRRREDSVELAFVQFVAPLLGPHFAQVAAGAVDCLGDIPEVALGVVEVDDFRAREK